MVFVDSTQKAAVMTMSAAISEGLQSQHKVLWLTSGGSNVPVEVAIMRNLRNSVSKDLPLLTIVPMDERYGGAGHADSNTEALRQAGFDVGLATWLDVLANNLPFADTVVHYDAAVQNALSHADLVVGQFGIGSDGHIAGILPESPACRAGSATVMGYEWSDYTRMTMTAAALKRITLGYVVAFGDAKRDALERLQKNEESFEQLPACLLYELPEVYVYNDQLEQKE